MKTFKWLFVGDLQLPYVDKRALSLMMKVAKSWKPDAVDYTGDIADLLEYSSFSDGTTDEFFNQLAQNKKDNDKDLSLADAKLVLRAESPMPHVYESGRVTRDFYTDMRGILPNADMHVSEGNHESRIYKYVTKKMPEYVDEVTPEFVWGLDSLGISWRHYEEKPLERFAGIHVHHGTTVTDTGLAVKGDIDKYNISLVRGHDHRGGVVYKSYPLSGNTLVGMGTGHLCDPSQYGLQYTINPSWELGFGIAHVTDNVAHLQFIPITPDYVCVVDGKIFKG